jgi:hypothetical protein
MKVLYPTLLFKIMEKKKKISLKYAKNFLFLSFKSLLKLSGSQSSSSTSIASTPTSRPITPPNSNHDSGTESYVNIQQQSFKIIPPNKSSIIADKARRAGISNPVVNFGKLIIYIIYIKIIVFYSLECKF